MAANKERGELALNIEGQSYTLKLTTNAVCEMETLSGRTFDQVMLRIQHGSMSDIRLFFWAALQSHHPKVTLVDVGDLIDAAGGLGAVKTQLDTLLGINTEEAKAAAPNPPAAQAGAGVASTLTPVGSV